MEGPLPGQVLAARCGPFYHVGEANAVVPRKVLVMRVVELLLGEAGQEKALP